MSSIRSAPCGRHMQRRSAAAAAGGSAGGKLLLLLLLHLLLLFLLLFFPNLFRISTFRRRQRRWHRNTAPKKKETVFFFQKIFFLVNRYRKCIVSLLWTQLCIFISDLLNIIFLHLNKKMAEFNPYLKKEISCNEHSLFERLF